MSETEPKPLSPNIPKRFKIGIVGPGAIGTAIAALISRTQDFQPILYDRNGPVSRKASFNFDSEKYTQSFEIPSYFYECSLWIIAVKAYQLKEAIPKETFGIHWVLSNGAIQEELKRKAQNHPDMTIRQGICSFGSKLLSCNNYQLTLHGQLQVGNPLEDSTQPSQTEKMLIEQMGRFLAWHPKIGAVARKKWLFNTVLNSFCAYKDLPTNGASLYFLENLEIIFREAFDLGSEIWGLSTDKSEGLWKEFLTLIENTASNENSMRRDLRMGKPLEAAYLTGVISQSGHNYPYLQKIHNHLAKFC